MKKNCWEAKGCGREPGGYKVSELGICPASMQKELDAVHNGKNAGRACWVVSGTFCGGKPQGTFAKKFSTCKECDFYQQVKKEEYPKFYPIALLLNKIDRNSNGLL